MMHLQIKTLNRLRIYLKTTTLKKGLIKKPAGVLFTALVLMKGWKK
jgi:hypothetical protein